MHETQATLVTQQPQRKDRSVVYACVALDGNRAVYIPVSLYVLSPVYSDTTGRPVELSCVAVNGALGEAGVAGQRGVTDTIGDTGLSVCLSL